MKLIEKLKAFSLITRAIHGDSVLANNLSEFQVDLVKYL